MISIAKMCCYCPCTKYDRRLCFYRCLSVTTRGVNQSVVPGPFPVSGPMCPFCVCVGGGEGRYPASVQSPFQGVPSFWSHVLLGTGVPPPPPGLVTQREVCLSRFPAGFHFISIFKQITKCISS